MKALPQGWVEATVGDLGDYINGLAFKPTDWGSDGRPIIRIQNLTDSSKPFNFTDRSVSDEYIVRAGDLLVSWSATLDAFIWDRAEAVLNQHIFKVVPNSLVVDRKFLYFRLKETIRELISSEHLHGSTMKHINRGPFLAKSLPLPPLDEQTRIASKLDALFEKSRSIREKLDRLPRLLANLQKSILNSAFRGDLTKEWRANNPNVEPASELLKRIRAERRAKWEADLIAKGKAPKRAKYVEPEPVNAEGLPELPEGWCWASGAELFIWGSGDFLPKSQQEDGDFPVYGGNGVAGSHSSGNVDHIALVIGRVGANCGNAHLTCGAAWITDNAIFSRWSAPSLNLGFAQIFLSLHDIRSQAQGGGQPFVSQGTLNSIAIPVPPLSEQKEILSSASASMDRLSALSGLINTTQEKITSYETSSLAKAFRGELVPQDPNDEPASVLLERIRAQKPAAGTKRGRGRKTAA